MKQTLGRIAAGLLGQASNATLSFFSNNRTDSTGVDLNRRWDCPSKEMEPSLYWTKELLRKIDGEDGRRLDIFIDVHAHSTCKRSFMFCNPPKSLEISALGSEPEMRERERDYKTMDALRKVLIFLEFLDMYMLEFSLQVRKNLEGMHGRKESLTHPDPS